MTKPLTDARQTMRRARLHLFALRLGFADHHAQENPHTRPQFHRVTASLRASRAA